MGHSGNIQPNIPVLDGLQDPDPERPRSAKEFWAKQLRFFPSFFLHFSPTFSNHLIETVELNKSARRNNEPLTFEIIEMDGAN